MNIPVIIPNPFVVDPDEAEWRKGDRVLWPNGVEGEVMAVDFDDRTVMDECGGWHPIAFVDRLS